MISGCRVLLLAAAVFTLSGCASWSSDSTDLPAHRIEPGITTQEQVRSWYGDPDAERVDFTGMARWSYAREVERGRLEQTANFAAHWLKRPAVSLMVWVDRTLFYPPRPVPRAAVIPAAVAEDTLSVSFGPDGVVTEYAYDRRPR